MERIPGRGLATTVLRKRTPARGANCQGNVKGFEEVGEGITGCSPSSVNRDRGYGLGARWRGAGPDLLSDLPTAVSLVFKNDDVAAFGFHLSAGGHGG
jgi:hypothetical protein